MSQNSKQATESEQTETNEPVTQETQTPKPPAKPKAPQRPPEMDEPRATGKAVTYPLSSKAPKATADHKAQKKFDQLTWTSGRLSVYHR